MDAPVLRDGNWTIRFRFAGENTKTKLQQQQHEFYISTQALAERFSTPLGLSRDCCLCALTELQSAALENLDSRTLFQDAGMNQLFFVYFK